MIPPSNPQRSQSACSSLTDLRSYDFFGRITENVQMDSGPSRKIFFTMSFLLAFAFVGEVLFEHSERHTEEKYAVDPKFGDAYEFTLNVSFPNLPCDEVTIDSLDSMGEARLHLMQGFSRTPLKNGIEYDESNACQSCYDATSEEHKCCNSCLALRKAYKNSSLPFDSLREKAQCINVGCRVEGRAPIHKVAGDMRIAVGRMVHYRGKVYQDIDAEDLASWGFNASHIIHDIRFGHTGQESLQMPLSGVSHTQTHTYVTYVYSIHFVPTEYNGKGGTHQYSFNQVVVNETRMAEDGIPVNVPGFYLDYEFSPLVLDLRTRQADLGQLAVKAIIAAGGAFSLLQFAEVLFGFAAAKYARPAQTI